MQPVLNHKRYRVRGQDYVFSCMSVERVLNRQDIVLSQRQAIGSVRMRRISDRKQVVLREGEGIGSVGVCPVCNDKNSPARCSILPEVVPRLTTLREV